MSLWHYIFPSFNGRRDASPYWYDPPGRRGARWTVALAFVAGAGAAYAVTLTNWDASKTADAPRPARQAQAAPDPVSARSTGPATAATRERAARFEELKEVAALAANSAPPASNEEDQATSALASAEDGQAAVAEPKPEERASPDKPRPPKRKVHTARRSQQPRHEDTATASDNRLVYLYDEIQPNGERVRVYRRARGRDEAAIAPDGYGRRRFFDFDPPWERW